MPPSIPLLEHVSKLVIRLRATPSPTVAEVQALLPNLDRLCTLYTEADFEYRIDAYLMLDSHPALVRALTLYAGIRATQTRQDTANAGTALDALQLALIADSLVDGRDDSALITRVQSVLLTEVERRSFDIETFLVKHTPPYQAFLTRAAHFASLNNRVMAQRALDTTLRLNPEFGAYHGVELVSEWLARDDGKPLKSYRPRAADTPFRSGRREQASARQQPVVRSGNSLPIGVGLLLFAAMMIAIYALTDTLITYLIHPSVLEPGGSLIPDDLGVVLGFSMVTIFFFKGLSAVLNKEFTTFVSSAESDDPPTRIRGSGAGAVTVGVAWLFCAIGLGILIALDQRWIPPPATLTIQVEVQMLLTLSAGLFISTLAGSLVNTLFPSSTSMIFTEVD